MPWGGDKLTSGFPSSKKDTYSAHDCMFKVLPLRVQKLHNISSKIERGALKLGLSGEWVVILL